MKLSVVAMSSVLVASSSFANFVPGAPQVLLATGITGSGVYAQPGITWNLSFSFSGDLSQSSLNGDFGNWVLTVSGSDGTSWSSSRSETDGGSYSNVTSGRIFSVLLSDGSGGTQGTPPLLPAPTELRLKYTAIKVNNSWVDLDSALNYSANPSTVVARRGLLSVSYSDSSFSTGVISGYFTVPAPGTAALVALAGMISKRRRTA